MPKILKNILILCVVAFVIGLGLMGYGAWKTFFTNGDLAVVTLPIQDRTPLYVIQVQYPAFPTSGLALNKEIAEYVTNRVAQFKQNAQDNWKARQDTLPANQRQNSPDQQFTFQITWDKAQVNKQYVSIVLHVGAYEGGASGLQELKTFNYDLVNKRNVQLADLFPGRPDYLSKLSAIARAQLAAHLRDAQQSEPDMAMLNAGTTPTADNFSNFTFNENMLTIYFPKYQVAAGAAGEQQIIVDITQL